jgi:hypothetical protein
MAQKIIDALVALALITYGSVKYVTSWIEGFLGGIIDRIFFPEFVNKNDWEDDQKNKED